MKLLATSLLVIASLAGVPAIFFFGMMSVLLWILAGDTPGYWAPFALVAGLGVLLVSSLIGGWVSLQLDRIRLAATLAVPALVVSALGLYQQWQMQTGQG